jgi:hypothetical protein
MRPGIPVLVVCAQLACGCSLAFTRRPPIPVDPAEGVSCSESRAAPIADTALAAVFLGAAVALVVHGATLDPARNRAECASCLVYATTIVPLTYAAGTGASAWVGFDRTARCRRTHARQRACLAGDHAACGALQREAESEVPEAPASR